MDYRRLGNSDLTLSVVSFVTWGIGGPPFWTAVRDEQAVAALRRAFDLGITCFDTAPAYGLGHAERVLAKALRTVRHEVVYATKVGLRWKGSGTADIFRELSAASIRYEVEESLRRLETDVIDLYQVHWPDANVPIVETFSTLADLRSEGKIRNIGVSNFTTAMIDEARRHAPIVSLQPRYNMLDRFVERDLQAYCLEHQIGMLAYSPLASGLLTGKYDRNSRFDTDWRGTIGDMFRPGAFERNLDMVDMLRPIASELRVTMPVFAIAWVLARDGVTTALAGANTPEQVEENVRAADLVIPRDVMQRVDSILNQA